MDNREGLYYKMLEAEDRVTMLRGALDLAFKSFLRSPTNPDDLISLMWEYYLAVDEYDDLRYEYEKAAEREEEEEYV